MVGCQPDEHAMILLLLNFQNLRDWKGFAFVILLSHGNVGGQVRSLLDKRVEAAVTVALVSGAVRAVKSLSISSRIALN